MTTRYTQLQPEECMTLASMRQQGFSLRAIDARLGRIASTLSREWRRNDETTTTYTLTGQVQSVSTPERTINST